jgi:hypothetical protein
MHLGVACLLAVSLPIFLIDFAAIFFYSWENQLIIALVDMLIISVVSISAHIMLLKQVQ